MHIQSVCLKGFRNFSDTQINFSKRTLVIGGNDVGKTNLLYALRLLLDKGLSDADIEPSEIDFHINLQGEQAETLSILIEFSNVKEDAVLSKFAGHVGEDSKTYLKYEANRFGLEYKIFVGRNGEEMEEVNSRFYLRHLSMRYIKSQRDLKKYIQREKKHLLRLSQANMGPDQKAEDSKMLKKIGISLSGINNRIRKLNYVSSATSEVNEELKSLAHHQHAYSVQLDTGAIEVNQFIDSLELAANTNGSKIMLGGDGRNNQVLLALWKAKSMREHDHENEVVIYCVEEPEVHLHPHQQRKLASYLIEQLPGQSIVTTHSPQITANYKPDSIVRILVDEGKSIAASSGCSDCISEAWDGMGYRMSILPAEAFFASAVLLVEGPSEVLFYTQLAERLNIDLDYYNISILSVEGIQFKVYVKILDAMEIPWAVRTDNDISNITVGGSQLRNLSGINRCLSLAGLETYDHKGTQYSQDDSLGDGTWGVVSGLVNPEGIFLSKKDLEHDLGDELAGALIEFKGPDLGASIAYLQKKKAIRMRKFLASHGDSLEAIGNGTLVWPLIYCVSQVEGVPDV